MNYTTHWNRFSDGERLEVKGKLGFLGFSLYTRDRGSGPTVPGEMENQWDSGTPGLGTGGVMGLGPLR